MSYYWLVKTSCSLFAGIETNPENIIFKYVSSDILRCYISQMEESTLAKPNLPLTLPTNGSFHSGWYYGCMNKGKNDGKCHTQPLVKN